MALPDIELAFESFQDAYEKRLISLRPTVLDGKLLVHIDIADGDRRITFARLEGSKVMAMVQVIRSDDYKGEPCFNVAWCVHKDFRRQGRAVEAFNAAVKEFAYGLGRSGVKAFWVEAIVSVDNIASQGVAAKAISGDPISTTDGAAGVPVLQYLRHISEVVVEPL